jgi:hypothetical protein
MPESVPGILPRATLRRRLRAPLAIALLLAIAPATASAEGPIARAARAYVASHAPEVARAPAPGPQGRQRRRGPGRIVAGAAVGAVGGFFAGGYLGAAIDGDCGGCDDPGLKGALIGAPIGALAGGILGGKFLF